MPKERKKNPLPPALSPTKPPTIPVGESRKTSGHSGNMWKYIIGILSAVLVSVVALALFFFCRTRPCPDSQDTSVPWKTGLSGQLQKAFVTGVTLGEGTGATMSEDEDDLQADFSLDQSGNDVHDMMGFGPLLPTESERSLMERVRQELKIELKQGFRSKIEDVREEILRKRRAGKLPGDTTSVLKVWWQQHSKWPYPTAYWNWLYEPYVAALNMLLAHASAARLYKKKIQGWHPSASQLDWSFHDVGILHISRCWDFGC